MKFEVSSVAFQVLMMEGEICDGARGKGSAWPSRRLSIISENSENMGGVLRRWPLLEGLVGGRLSDVPDSLLGVERSALVA
jgi:hypothetical protein